MGADAPEDADQAGEGSEQSQERGDAGGDFKEDETGLQARDLVAGPCLDGIENLRPRPILVLDHAQEDSGER